MAIVEQGIPRRPVPHYMNGGLEVIDILRTKMTEEQYRGFCLGNALKYLFRFPYKGTPVEDLHKAETYTRWLRETFPGTTGPSESPK